MKLTKSDYTYIRRWAKKIKAIHMKGNKCVYCGNDDIVVLSFHHYHNSNKKEWISNLLSSYANWYTIEKELHNCELVCENCHRKLHYIPNHDNISFINKKTFLTFVNSFKCSKCGYHECTNALEFHHKIDKNFKLSAIKTEYRTVTDLTLILENELKKCNVLCSNCHRKEHFDYHRFNKMKDRIFNLVINYKEHKKLDHYAIMNLFNKGYKQVEICKLLGYSKSSVSTIVTKLSTPERSRTSADVDS